MFTRLNTIFNIIIKGIFETTIISISGVLFLFFIGNIDDSFIINMILTLSLVNYLCAHALSFYVFKGASIDDRKKHLIVLFALAISLASAFITSKEITIAFVVIYFIIYLLVWYKSMVSIIDERDNESTKKSFKIGVIFFIIMVLIISVNNGKSITAQKIKMFFPLYVGASLSYFATVNLATAYNKKNTNSLNKVKNIKIINLISTSLILLILLFTLTGFFGVWEKIFSSKIVKTVGFLLQKIIEFIVYPLALLITKTVEYIYSRAKHSLFEQLNNGERVEETETIVIEALSPKAQFVIDILSTIIKWGIIIMIIYLIIIYIIKTINNRKLSKNKEEEDEEEKEFILSPKDIKKEMGKSLRKIASNVSRLFLKPKNHSQDLPIIRRIYLDTILHIEEKGYKFQNYYTPNEYLSTIKDSKYINAGIKDLTDIYNDCRYSGKEPTKEKVEKCISIKNSIYEISKEK